MKKSTEIIIQTALEDDPQTKNKVGQVMLLLKTPDYNPSPISESVAAKILGVSQATLNLWRRDTKRAKDFPFSIMVHLGRILYDENEIRSYVRNNMKKGALVNEAAH